MKGSQAHSPVAQFRVDVTENENAYVVRAEIPGVKKDDINISIDGDQVAISAEVKNEKDVKDGERVAPLRALLRQGLPRFPARPAGRTKNGAVAKYNDGILELTLPKKAAASAKRITIQ